MGRTRTRNPNIYSHVLGPPASPGGLERQYNYVNRFDGNLGPVAFFNMLNTPSGSASTTNVTPLITVNGPTEFYQSIIYEQPQVSYEFVLLNRYDHECNLFIKYDMSTSYELNIICVGGGGGGGGQDVVNDSLGSVYSETGGGAGGAIVQIYDYISKAGDMISMCQGSKGIGGSPKNNGSAGKSSYIKYYAYDNNPDIYKRNDFVAYCCGGNGGGSSTKGYALDPYILMCPKDGTSPFVATLDNLIFEAGNGGNGGETSKGETSYSLSAAGGDFKTKIGNYNGPLDDPSSGIPMYSSYSGGGGGGTSDLTVQKNIYYGGGGAGGFTTANTTTIVYGQGGYEGSQTDGNAPGKTYTGVSATYPGAGGGGGGVTTNSADPVQYTQYGGGDGADGLVMLIIRKHPSGDSWFSTSYSTQTYDNNYTIIPVNPNDSGKDYAYYVTPNSTRPLNAVLVASGGGGGAASRGETNGGGGGGGFCLTTFTPSSNTNSLQITVGSPVRGGKTSDGQETGINGNNTLAELASGGKSVLVYGGQPGSETAGGYGGIANSSPYGTGGRGGDASNGNPGTPPTDPNVSDYVLFPDPYILRITSLITNNYSGGGSGGKGGDDSGNNYPAGIAGYNNGQGGVWNSGNFSGKPAEGLISTGIGGGGGAGGYEGDQTEFWGGTSTSGVCILYYPINY
jgi:hypothetical protein